MNNKMKLKKRAYAIHAIVRYAVKKIIVNKKFILTLLVAVFLSVVCGYAVTQNFDTIANGATLLDTFILSLFLPIMTMVYSSSVIRDEIEDKSITMVLASPLQRYLIYLSYWFAVMISLSIVMVLITSSGFFTFFGLTELTKDAMKLYLVMCGLVLVGSLAYSALFLLVSLLLKKPIYFSLFYAFVWEGFLGSLPGKIHEIAINHYIRSIGAEWVEWGSLSFYSGTALWCSFSVISVLTILLLFAGVLILSEKELT
ncbi:MAG: hypothetical protein GWO20_15715 [Candidatus Korarchaeota archaeon]|nr:hypothetical protein [Candidatus Korarchaeota archaeon]NIU84843.1 hypothetical protein [Candidatus Thorarchaeota archaeon]NIW14861.1 hypothetical protein [Candidatus Thorarchaeota archaeon]NIW52902.1 hypothetical protein [Candidatus Korarchaeota archaeon]